MYKINRVESAGHQWWRVIIDGPKDIEIPFKRYHPGMGLREIWAKAQAWCDKENRKFGWKPKREANETYRRTGRNWATVRLEKKGRR